MVTFIYVEQLDILGFTEQYRLLSMLIVIVCLSFYLITPIIKWLVERKFSTILAFLVISLMMLNIFFALSFVTHNKNIAQIGLQALVGFGCIITFYLLMKVIVHVVRRIFAIK